MLDLKKLNTQVELKNFDLDGVIKIFTENQNSIIKIVLIMGSLLIVGLMFNDHHIKDEALRVKVSQAKEKIEALRARDAAVANLVNFKSSLPGKLNEFELITLISDYAKSQHINITSLSPAENKDMGLYDVINVGFDAVSDNFKDMMLFLAEIEKSKYPLRIDSCEGSENENGQITFVIVISAVLIHI